MQRTSFSQHNSAVAAFVFRFEQFSRTRPTGKSDTHGVSKHVDIHFTSDWAIQPDDFGSWPNPARLQSLTDPTPRTVQGLFAWDQSEIGTPDWRADVGPISSLKSGLASQRGTNRRPQFMTGEPIRIAHTPRFGARRIESVESIPFDHETQHSFAEFKIRDIISRDHINLHILRLGSIPNSRFVPYHT